MISKIIFTFVSSSAAAYQLMTPLDYEFMGFVSENGRSYATREEYNFRKSIFADTQQRLANLKLTNSTVEVNRLADRTPEERQKMLGLKLHQNKERSKKTEETQVYFNFPESLDWREKGAVTPIKDQGFCGSCWAFSATGAMEAAHFVKSGELVSLSEQQLVDCDHDSENNGCRGGLMDNAFEYTFANPMQLEADYPYVANDDGKCSYDK